MSVIIVIVVVLMASNVVAEHVYHLDATCDLDGDGREDRISIRPNVDKDSKCSLTVNNSTLDLWCPEYEGFTIVDVDTSDICKELIIKGEGYPIVSCMLYRYNGTDISMIGSFGGFEEPDNRGNGIIYNDSWAGFWTVHEVYVYDANTKALREEERYWYSVDTSGRTFNSIPAYKYPGAVDVVKMLAPDCHINILFAIYAAEGMTEGFWYLVAIEDDIIGWVEGDVLEDNCSLNFAG